MIKAILIFNNHGKPRLNKFYQYYVSTLSLKYVFMLQNNNSIILSKGTGSVHQ